MTDRDKMQKPDWMNDAEWAWFKERTASVELIVSDAKADVQAYLASPAGRSTGQNAQGGFPTLLLTTIGRKSGEKRTTPPVFMRHGKALVVAQAAGKSLNQWATEVLQRAVKAGG